MHTCARNIFSSNVRFYLVCRMFSKTRVYVKILDQIFIYWLYVWLPLHSRCCVWLYTTLVTDPPSRPSQFHSLSLSLSFSLSSLTSVHKVCIHSIQYAHARSQIRVVAHARKHPRSYSSTGWRSQAWNRFSPLKFVCLILKSRKNFSYSLHFNANCNYWLLMIIIYSYFWFIIDFICYRLRKLI